MEITVRKGDTLWALAKQHLGNALRWRELWEANKDAIEREQHRVMRRDLRGPNWIVPGTKLVLAAHGEQAAKCPDHPTGRLVDDDGKRICETCGRH